MGASKLSGKYFHDVAKEAAGIALDTLNGKDRVSGFQRWLELTSFVLSRSVRLTSYVIFCNYNINVYLFTGQWHFCWLKISQQGSKLTGARGTEIFKARCPARTGQKQLSSNPDIYPGQVPRFFNIGARQPPTKKRLSSSLRQHLLNNAHA